MITNLRIFQGMPRALHRDEGVWTLSSTRAPKRPAGPLDTDANHATLEMIVDQAHGLHEGVHRGRADEFPAALLELLGQRNGFR